ncbi:hypothetical protein GCK32_007355, partial [Trichostrongylus colubriformis]
DTTEQYRISGFSILEPEKEPLAISRLTNLVSSNKLPRSVMRSVQAGNVSKKPKFLKRKNRRKKQKLAEVPRKS